MQYILFVGGGVILNIVVFGGSGFLGSHIADALTDAGHSVIIFDLNKSPWISRNQQMVIGNILNINEVLNVMEGNVDYVYHMAGIANISEAASTQLETIETNIIGSTHIIEACARMNVKRILFASSVYVFSHKGSLYRVSKQAVESILEAYHEKFNLEYTILRYGSLYGPRAQDWNGLKQYVRQAVSGDRIVYPGTGEERREYIHVKDAAKLSIQAIAEEYANQCLTITGNQILSTNEVMMMIQEILGRKIEIEFLLNNSGYDMFHYSLTPYRYTPRRGEKIVPNQFVDIGEGILDMIEDVETNHYNGE